MVRCGSGLIWKKVHETSMRKGEGDERTLWDMRGNDLCL